MLNIYEEYETQEERESAVMLEQAEISMEKAVLAGEMMDRMTELSMREAECKLVMESADPLDLAEYYEEATSDGQEKKDGIIKTIWNKILNLLKTIKEKLFGVKVDPKSEVEVDQSFLERHQKLGAVVKKLQEFFASPLRVVGTIVASVGVVAAFIAIKKKGKTQKVTGAVANKIQQEFQKAIDTIHNGVSNLFSRKKGGEKSEEDKAGGPISRVISGIKESMSEFREKANDVMRGSKRLTGVMGSGSSADEIDESADIFNFDDDLYAEDAGDLSDIAELLATI